MRQTKPKTDPIGGLTDEEWTQRLKYGRSFMRKFRTIDRGACIRFRDPSLTATSTIYDDEGNDPSEDDSGGDLPQDVVVGQPNLLTVSELVKLSAVTIRRPDFLIQMKDGAPPEGKKTVRDKFRNTWKKKDWNRRAQMAYLKRCMVGHGFVGYRWDAKIGEPDYTHVQSWNLCIDPCLNDWQNIRWGGYRITVPLREAMALYPDAFKAEEYEPGQPDKKKIKIWLLYDKQAEVHILDSTKDGNSTGPSGKVLKRARNRYGRVPLLCLEGDPDPGPSEFALGDSQLATGLQQEYNDANQAISDIAKHGGPLNLYVASGMSKATSEAMESGKPQQWLPVNDLSDNGIPIKRVEGEQIHPALLEAKQTARQALQEFVGVTPSMLGSPMENARFATDVAAVNAQSGVRTIQARSEYEQFLDKWAESCLRMWIEFGGPEYADKANPAGGMKSTPQDVADWEVLRLVESVAVVEASTMYRDPQQDITSAMQLYQMMMNSYELFLTRAQMGLTDKLPNMEAYANDVLRSQGKQNVDEYWVPYQAPPQKQEGKPPTITISYKDLDPQDQMAAAQLAGLPGQQPGPPQNQNGAGQAPVDPQAEMAKQDDQQAHDASMQAMKHAHETRMQQMKHGQALELEQMRQQHAAHLKLAEMGHQARMADHQAQVQSAQQERQLQTQQALAKEKGASGGKANGGG